MKQAAALSSLGVVLFLVLSRPRVRRIRIGPAHAAAVGVGLMFVAGLVRPDDIIDASKTLWRPLITVTAIMVMAAAAHHVGLLARLAGFLVPVARGSTSRLFALVFGLSVLTASVLNNDAAILLLTPLVVFLVRRAYPDRPRIVIPFVFAVFQAAGVAPFVVSNPMNMILASIAHIGFNTYAATMLPIAFVGWVISFLVLRLLFRKQIAEDPHMAPDPTPVAMTRVQWQILGVLVCVLGSYPLVALLRGPIWVVATTGAIVALVLSSRSAVGAVGRIVKTQVSWETLLFLVGALIIALGLRNAGVVTWLASVYRGADVMTIGVASAMGSAVINNHPMALTNLFALREAGNASQHLYLAAVIGGDLGPGLLPTGSLAGLLWFASLRRLDVEVSVARFAAVGAAVTVPSLLVSLALLTRS